MKPVRQQKVREILRANPEGMSAIEISNLSGMHVANVRTSLRAMPDVYVDRWRQAKRGYEKVWVAVQVPEDCPHPRDKEFKGGRGKPKSVWQPVAKDE